MSEEIGRNDPCPCGSKKKYKKCCWKKSQKKSFSERKFSSSQQAFATAAGGTPNKLAGLMTSLQGQTKTTAELREELGNPQPQSEPLPADATLRDKIMRSRAQKMADQVEQDGESTEK